MKIVECGKCGSNELFHDSGYMVCAFCRVKFIPRADDRIEIGSAISLDDDVRILLNKCLSDPDNSKRYANLVLDIDPTNAEALKYI